MAGLYKAGSSLLDIAKSGKAKAAGLFAALQSEDAEAASGAKIVNALVRKINDANIPDTSWRGWHTAPIDPEYHAPLHEMNKIYPDDIYSPQAARYYGHGDHAMDKESMDIIQGLRGKPDDEIDMFRAVPSGAPDEILPGDWVTPNETYARQHGEGIEDYKILKGRTTAKQLRTDGNSPHEFGYTGSADPRLLAGIAGAGAIGTGAAALYTPEQNQAYADQLAKMGIYEHTDSITPEKFPGLYSAGNALDRIETPLDPLMGRGWATSGISKYLKDFGERKGGSLESLYDSAGAVMDVM